MLRSYLINVHKFFFHYHGDDESSAIMPAIIFGLSFSCLIGSYDILFNNRSGINWLIDMHRLAVTVPGYLIIFFIYLWYRTHLPSRTELLNKKGMWSSILLSLIPVLICLLLSILY